MMNTFENKKVTVAFLLSESLPYDVAAFGDSVQAALGQDHELVDVVVVDGRGDAAQADFLPAGVDAGRVRHVAGSFVNRAAMCNAALEGAGDYLLVVYCDRAQVVLKRSAVRTMVMAAVRGHGLLARATPHRSETGATNEGRGTNGGAVDETSATGVGLVYGDYERVTPDGGRAEVHLLDWHAGRLRDTVDFGSAILFSTAALRAVGGFDERYDAADFYDIRLKVSERHGVAHIANRYAGTLCSVAAPAEGHNVFAYLLADKNAQLEMERACTEHLQRSGAKLEPGAHVRSVEYSPEEEQRFAECIASVVTPVNNRPEFVGRAIESVQAQTVPQVEMIIVVNGGQDDPTADEVRRYMEGGDKYDANKPPVRLIVVDINNLGLCLNTGIAAARGKYYVQLDSDDRLKPDAVEKLLAVFDSDLTIGMVVGSYEVWTLDGASGELQRNDEIPVVTHDEWTADNGRNNLLRINGAGAPRSAHIKAIADAGWFGVNDTDQCRNYGEDYDLVLRTSERYTIGRVWDPIYEVIRHAGGTDHAIDQATVDRNDNAKDFMRLEALERRQRLNRA